MADRIDLNDDDVDWGDDLRLQYRGEPFTGEVVETIAGFMIGQSFYVNGIENGLRREWFLNGRLKVEGEIRGNSGRGIIRKWHENGQLAAEEVYNGLGQLETVREWDSEGNPINGRSDGGRAGSMLFRVIGDR